MMKKYWTLLSVITLGLMILAGNESRGASTAFETADGAWTNGPLWTSGAPPVLPEGARVGKSGGVTCTIGSGDSVVAEFIQVGRRSGTSTSGNSGTLVIDTGGRLDMAGTATSYIGHNKNVTGTVTVAGGALNGGSATRDVVFGYNNPSYGVLNISAGSVTNIDLRVATRNGTSGEINLSGTGLLVPGAALNLGIHASGSGTLNQTGGTLNGNSKNLRVGDAGTGTYRLSSGNATNFTALYVGDDGGSVGLVELSGDGLLRKKSGITYIGNASGSSGTVVQTGGTWDHNGNNTETVIGQEGVGVYTITDGLLTGLDVFLIGRLSGSSGRLELSGDGRIERTSGGYTQIGYGSGATGTVVMTGGTWDQDGNRLQIGRTGVGTFDLSGGSITNIANIRLGVNSGSDGTLNISGTGEMETGSPMSVGYGAGGTGELTVSDGSLTFTLDKILDIGNSGVGTVNLSGGSITGIDELQLGVNSGAHGTLNISGTGMIEADNDVSIGYGAGSTGVVTVSGGTLLMNAIQPLYVGNGGTGTLTVTGGTITNAATIHVGNNGAGAGTFSISDGDIFPKRMIVGGTGAGTFTIDGSDASITLKQAGDYAYKQNANGILRVVPDAGGITTITCPNSGTAPELDGTLEIDLSNFDGHTDELVLIDHNGTITGTFSATNVLTAGWTAEVAYDDTADEVRLVNIRSASTRFETSDGAWTNAALWTSVLPTATSDATIEKSGGITCTIATGDDADAADLTVGDTDAGAVTMTGGTLDAERLTVGDSTAGALTVSGGTLDADYLTLGASAAGSGSVTIGGSATVTIDTDLENGAYDGVISYGSANTLTISGSSATIYAADDYRQNAASTLRFVADSGGVSTMNFGDEFKANGALIVDLSGMDSVPDTLTLVQYSGTLSGGSHFDTETVLPSGWSGTVVYDQVNDRIVLTNITTTVTRFDRQDGAWETGANWNPVVPTAALDAYVGKSGGVTATIGAGVDAVTDELRVGNEQPGTIVMTDGTLTPASAPSVGYDAAGTFTQSGGAVNGGGLAFYVGNQSGASGTYNLNGGSLTNAALKVGESGTGSFGLSGTGLFKASASIEVGAEIGSTGTVTQTGGTWDNNNKWLQVGKYGKGTYTITNGTLDNLNSVQIGRYGGSQGTFELSGSASVVKNANSTHIGNVAGSSGTVTQTGSSTWNHAGQDLYIGNFGVGTYNLSAGSVTNIDEIFLGRENGGHGTLNISGTGLMSTANHMTLGYAVKGTGVVAVSGGTLRCTDNSKELTVGRNGSGSLTVSGGVVTNFHQLVLGYYLNGRGTLEISDGTLYCEDLRLGWTGVQSTNTVRIIGSAADITFSDDILGVATNTTWHFAPDSGGISTINVGDDFLNSQPSGTVEVDFSSFDGHTNELVLFDYGTISGDGTRAAEFTATNILTAGWSADIEYVDGSTDQIKLINISSPATRFETSDGAWTNTALWTSTAPIATSDATIEKSGGITCTIATGDDADADRLTVGDSNAGALTVSGGTLDADTLTLGATASGSGSVTISGSATVTIDTDLENGAYDGVSSYGSTNTLTISGSSATINVTDDYRQNALSTLRFIADSAGVSTMNFGDDFKANGTLIVDLTAMASIPDSLTLVQYNGSLSGSTHFDTETVLPAGWSGDVEYDTVNDRIYLTNIAVTATRFNQTDGAWNVGGNWSPVVPTASLDAYVGKSGGITATIGAGVDAVTDQLRVGNEQPGTVVMTDGTLTPATASSVGYDAAGTFTQSGGAVNGGGLDFYLGRLSGASGTYNLSGGSLTNAAIGVGEYGTGALNLSDTGFFKASAGTEIAAQAGSTGTVTQTGGWWHNGGKWLQLGKYGNGTYTITNGTLSNVGTTYIGRYADAQGTFELSGSGSITKGGGLTAIGDLTGSTGAVVQTGGTWDHNSVDATMQIGRAGAGTYTITDGLLTGLDTFEIGAETGGSGRLELSGSGRIERVSPGTTIIGNEAGSTGTVVQTGGTWDQGNKYLHIAEEGVGSFALSGGSITNIAILRLGQVSGGDGTLNISGTGVMGLRNLMQIGYANGGTGVVTVSGGTLEFTAGSLDILVGRAGNGSLTVNGGTVSVTRNIKLADNATGTGTFEISGGTVTCQDIVMGSAGSGTVAALRIVGSGAAINLSDDLRSPTGSTDTYYFAPDAGGISTINVADDIDFGSGGSSTLELDFSNYAPDAGTFTLIDYNGNRTGGFTATNVTALGDRWFSVNYQDGTTDKIVVALYADPPTLFKFR